MMTWTDEDIVCVHGVHLYCVLFLRFTSTREGPQGAGGKLEAKFHS